MKKLIALFILVMISNTAFAGINIVAATTNAKTTKSPDWVEVQAECAAHTGEYDLAMCDKADEQLKKLEARKFVLTEGVESCKSNPVFGDVCEAAQKDIKQLGVLFALFALAVAAVMTVLLRN